MKRSLKNLCDYSLETKDGLKGKVKDFLFDEELWIIRYLEADFGNIFRHKKVLIPRIFLKMPEWDNQHFPVDILQKEIEKCPDLDDRVPVSREYEKELSKHYSINYYWPYGYSAPPGAVFYPPRPLKPPAKIVDEKDLDTHLRSYQEVVGYHIRAIDGKMGHVEDIIVDYEDWQIVYLVADTSNWLPWSKKVLLTIDWLKEISYADREVSIDLKTESIEKAPEYDPSSPVAIEYEKDLHDFYSRSIVK